MCLTQLKVACSWKFTETLFSNAFCDFSNTMYSFYADCCRKCLLVLSEYMKCQAGDMIDTEGHANFICHNLCKDTFPVHEQTSNSQTEICTNEASLRPRRVLISYGRTHLQSRGTTWMNYIGLLLKFLQKVMDKKQCSQFSYSVSSLSQLYNMMDSTCSILPHDIYVYMKSVSDCYLKNPFSFVTLKTIVCLSEMTFTGGSEWTSDLLSHTNGKIVCQLLCPWKPFHTKQRGFLHCSIVFVVISVASPILRFVWERSQIFQAIKRDESLCFCHIKKGTCSVSSWKGRCRTAAGVVGEFKCSDKCVTTWWQVL